MGGKSMVTVGARPKRLASVGVETTGSFSTRGAHAPATRVVGRSPRHGRGGRRRWGWTTQVLVLLAGPVFVFLWFEWFAVDTTTVSDDGAYAITALEMQDGWSVPHLLADTDPEGTYYPYQSPTVTDRGFFLAPRHIAWTAILGGTQQVFGDVGLRVFPAIGVALCAIGAFYLARSFGRRDAALGAAALVLTSPILLHGLQLWAHAVVAAAVTAAVIGVSMLLTSGFARGPAFLALLGCVVASVLRGDGFIFALAVAMAFAAALWRRTRQGQQPDFRLVAVAASLACAAALSLRGSALAARVVTGSSLGAVSPSPSSELTIAERAGALMGTLYSTPRSELLAFTLLVVVTCLTAAAVCILRTKRESVTAASLLLAASVVLMFRLTTDPWQPATGLIAGWPIVLFVGIRPWRRLGESERMAFTTVLLGIIGVALTQYEQGGAFSWGGRFLSPAVPLLATLAAVALTTIGRESGARLRLMPRVALFAACGFISMLWFDANTRMNYERHVELIALSKNSGVYVTSYRHIARADWGAYQERRWLRVLGIAELERVVSDLRDEGVFQFTAYGLTPDQALWLMEGPFPQRYVDANGTFWPPVEVTLAKRGSGHSASVALPEAGSP